jgi:GDPmannose 4,6-dehydratase
MVRNYRDGYGIHASNAISQNHESERRGENFLTHKVTKAVANIYCNRQKSLGLGNLTAERDWGYAPEFVQVFWKMLQQPEPDDYVIGTEETHTVLDWVQESFAYKGLDYRDYVKVDPEMLRPNDVNHLQADCTKAREKLGWNPQIKFKKLIYLMVDYDMGRVV